MKSVSWKECKTGRNTKMLLHKENKTDNTTTELFSSHSVQGTEEYRPQHDLFMGERKGKEEGTF